MNKKPILGISMGDPFGNGPEITVRALSDAAIYERCRPLVVGDASSMAYALKVAKKVSGIDLAMHVVSAVEEAKFCCGTIDVLDVRFGSLWTNIPRSLFLQTGVNYGDRVIITIENDTRCAYRNIIQYARSFADVYVGEALAYVNSLDCVAVAINQGSFARAYNIGTGNSWRIRIEPFRGFL